MDQKTLEQFENILNKALANVVTKDDARQFLTKDDAKKFLTKDDAKNFATKGDLKNFATRDDLKNFATKDDINAIKNEVMGLNDKIVALKDQLKFTKEELIEAIKDSEAFTNVNADTNKADKAVVIALERRVTIIEQKLIH